MMTIYMPHRRGVLRSDRGEVTAEYAMLAVAVIAAVAVVVRFFIGDPINAVGLVTPVFEAVFRHMQWLISAVVQLLG